MLVRLLERRGDLQAERERLLDGERSRREHGCQRLAGDTLHDDVIDLVLLADIKDGRDVRVTELGEGEGLLSEPAPGPVVGQNARRQHLDCHVAFEPLVTGPIHHAHAARAEQGDDLVGTESGACCQRHGTVTINGAGP